MNRRRLIVAIAAAVLCGVAWWQSLDLLSAEERLLVGAWTFDGRSGTGHSRMRFKPDRRCAYGEFWLSGPVGMIEWGGRWVIRDSALVFDGEPEPVRRAVRPILRGVGLSFNGAITYRLESIADDELVLVLPDGTRETWTRAPAD
jgi:hypothetical protein